MTPHTSLSMLEGSRPKFQLLLLLHRCRKFVAAGVEIFIARVQVLFIAEGAEKFVA